MSTKATLQSTIAISVTPYQGIRGYRHRVKSGVVAGTVLVTAMASTAALAAEADASTATLEEIVVTAQKRSERLLDVPMSVTAVTGAQLAASGITSTNDLGQVTPGLVTTLIGTGFTPSIRGVSSSGTSPGDESNVALYIDDVYVGDTLAGWIDLPDIERVEVLKGPQGTLFGRNATGGAIRVVTRAPSFTPETDVSADYGFNFREEKLSGFVTGPINEQAAASFSAFYRKGDGYVQGISQNVGKTYGGPDNYAFRGKLLFVASDTLKVTLAAFTSQTDDQAGALPTALNENPYPGPGSVGNTPFNYAGGTQPIQLVKSYGSNLDATWNPVNWLTMRSITAYTDYDLTYQVDIDRSNQPVSALALSATQQNFSQEFNFSGPPDQALTWLVGAYYYGSKAGNPYFTSYVGDAPNGTAVANFNNDERTNSYAAFTDLTWNITSQLHLTGGARYTTETKKFYYNDTVRPGGAANRDVNGETTWNSPTYRGVLRYDFSPDANVYVSVSDGFKSGVYNTFTPVLIPAKPEKIDALEIGAKAQLPGGFSLTAAAYGYNYHEIQVQAQTLVNGIPLLTLTNAASATIRGAELTAAGKVAEHLSFSAGVNWEPQAEYRNFTGAQVTIPIPGSTGPVVGQQVVPYNASGSRMIKAPLWTPNARLTYTTGFMGGSFAATVNYAYNSGFFWQAGNLTTDPAYTLVNARLSWTDPKDRWTFSLWGTNLTDTIYSTYTSPNTRGNTETYAQPLQIGVGAGLKF